MKMLNQLVGGCRFITLMVKLVIEVDEQCQVDGMKPMAS